MGSQHSEGCLVRVTPRRITQRGIPGPAKLHAAFRSLVQNDRYEDIHLRRLIRFPSDVRLLGPDFSIHNSQAKLWIHEWVFLVRLPCAGTQPTIYTSQGNGRTLASFSVSYPKNQYYNF